MGEDRTETLAGLLDRMTVEGQLYERLAQDRVRCYACGHRCTIFPGKRGICKVRFNEQGALKVPWGYVGALQCDPTEKKPFNHVLPGSNTLTFGMLGCDFHCPYCFPGETMVMTDRGPLALMDAFRSAERVERIGNAEIAYPADLRAVAGSGRLRQVRAIFKHHYQGRLLVIRPIYLPELRCTPGHRIYATADPTRPPEPVEAQHLTTRHYLAIPRRHVSPPEYTLDPAALLQSHKTTYRVSWSLSPADREMIAVASAGGQTSRQIGLILGKSASYIRHVRSKLAHGLVDEVRTRHFVLENGQLRFPKEHRPGIRATLSLDTELATLLGYYCAEGSIIRRKSRPNTYTLVFAFSRAEVDRAHQVQRMLRSCLGVKPRLRERETTLAVSVDKASAALLFQALAGKGSGRKHVPREILGAPQEVARAFLDAYVSGDGHRYSNGKVTVTTVSRNLAYGIAWLALRLGFLPSLYDSTTKSHGTILGREVTRAPHQYAVVWYEDTHVTRRRVETENYYLIPIRDVTLVEYEGDVYNMEVEEEHNYLSGFFLVANCQNYLTSQTLRDPAAGVEPVPVTPGQMIQLAQRYGARLVGSSYNEPLITSEWALAIFKEARHAGLKTCYISNGNATPEVLEYLRPWTDCYKIDLKAFNDRNYRLLGGTLESVTRSIRMVYEAGFWIEVVTLVIPGYNDSPEELRGAAEFIASVSPLIPWHVTAFHKDYKMTEPENTPAETLIRAARIGEEAGLKYVYAGNLPGRVGKYEHTFCHHCGALLVERFGYRILRNRLSPNHGNCPECGTAIPGLWH